MYEETGGGRKKWKEKLSQRGDGDRREEEGTQKSQSETLRLLRRTDKLWESRDGGNRRAGMGRMPEQQGLFKVDQQSFNDLQILKWREAG